MAEKTVVSRQEPPRLEILARGWEHSAWRGAFYPEDLPTDWRLTYYANEFPAVLVPNKTWRSAGAGLVSRWLDDVSPGFRFYLEIQAGTPVAGIQADEFARGLAGHFGGMVHRGRALGTPGNPASALLCPVSDRLSPPTSGQRTPDIDTGSVAVIVATQRLGSLRDQRVLLEWIGDMLPPGSVSPLIVEGWQPSMQAVQDLRQLAELMGLA